MSRKKKGFNSPFADLDKKVTLPAKLAPKTANVNVNAEQLFADEMLGVAPLDPDPRGRLGAPERSKAPRPSRRVEEDAEAYAQLADLVDSAGGIDLASGDEQLEGLSPGIDRRLLRQLKRGDYPLQGRLDLHGLTSEEASGAVERFVDGARSAGKRCVLIIHGRGQHSEKGVAILKGRLKVWLTRGRIAQAVLAFCSARPADGGAGALYVLLRK